MLLLPGGERSFEKLSTNAHSRRIIGHFLDAGKPIAAIDDGVGLLAIAQKLKGRTVAAPAQCHEALAGAGASVSEDGVRVDGVLVTARNLESLAEFVEQTVKVFVDAVALRKAA